MNGGRRSSKKNIKKIKAGADFDNQFNLDVHREYKCAPNVYAYKTDIYNERLGTFDTCYNIHQLKNMIIAYNKTRPTESRISEDILKTNDKDFMWLTLKEKLENECGNDEYCWTNDKLINKLPGDVKESVLTMTFKPERPMGKNGKTMNAWLSNFDISNVVEQLKRIYRDFEFLGPFPIDYEKYPEMYTLNMNVLSDLLRKGKKRIGIVFNTGTLKSGGIHWVALFLNFKIKHPIEDAYTIEYFDSVGRNPPKVIRNLIEQIKSGICLNFKEGCIKIHEKVKQLAHQKGNNECGVYCLYFISERLKGRSYEDLQANEMTDNIMFEFRNKFFMISKK